MRLIEWDFREVFLRGDESEIDRGCVVEDGVDGVGDRL